MKKILVSAVALMMLVSSNCFAVADFGGNASSTAISSPKQTQIVGVKTNQKQAQLQLQGQAQKTIVGGQANKQETGIQIAGDERELLGLPAVIPFEIPIIQNGKMGEFTQALPKMLGLTPLDKGKDTVIKVVGIFDGWVLNRIRLADIEEKLFEYVEDLKADGVKMENVRYQVWWQDAASSGGAGGGSAIGTSGTDGSGALSVLPGYHESTFDPRFIIKFFLIQ